MREGDAGQHPRRRQVEPGRLLRLLSCVILVCSAEVAALADFSGTGRARRRRRRGPGPTNGHPGRGARRGGLKGAAAGGEARRRPPPGQEEGTCGPPAGQGSGGAAGCQPSVTPQAGSRRTPAPPGGRGRGRGREVPALCAAGGRAGAACLLRSPARWRTPPETARKAAY